MVNKNENTQKNIIKYVFNSFKCYNYDTRRKNGE